ncbi:MAG: glycosyl transferase family protein [Fusobacteria bacterium]|nr:MAG: glycosyl transferase family protein [Fusobacteriota bacterium]KAF0228732.1 MAG: glycosyl transferase family [Fusobacteriota bacterium]
MEEVKIVEKSEKLISIIIPLGPGDSISSALKAFLDSLDNNNAIEVVIVAYDHESLDGFKNKFKYNIVGHQGTRASSLNLGSLVAEGEYLLFLHSDSYMEKSSFDVLMKRILKEQSALFYFDFRFTKGVPFYFKFTEIGVRFRCAVFKTPFGDQGLTISKENFNKMGKYNLKVPFGEDHYLVKECKAHNMDILSVNEILYTSPRKYLAMGWLKATIYHQLMWYRQILDFKKGKYRK